MILKSLVLIFLLVPLIILIIDETVNSAASLGLWTMITFIVLYIIVKGIL
jgi:hypothetical protein